MNEQEQLVKLKTKIDSITTDLKKFNGDPFPAIIEAWYKKVDAILNSELSFPDDFVSELKSFKSKAEQIRPNQPTDIGKHKQVIQELVENEFKKRID